MLVVKALEVIDSHRAFVCYLTYGWSVIQFKCIPDPYSSFKSKLFLSLSN